ncbi:meiotic recombination protein REC114 isoform X2 [Oreochromis niloticus]|uniref:REC114 meiotic recombination protein n=1 Tax=Oreochromis niloticus TaxID=8128 RepID=I3J3H1_ORENI|nr:meiotic recombination protein REC114 isoform X2 [Oreochromis niloticus]
MFRSGSSAGAGFFYSWLGLTENIKKTTPLLEMIATRIWKLKRYGRFIPGSKETGVKPWKVLETKDNKPEIVLTIVESGHLLVLQGQESLDTIPLLCGSDSIKVHQKSDNLIIRFIVKGESRMIRMQFDGCSMAEAINECSSAVEKLMEYIPVTTQDYAPPQPNQPPAAVPASAVQTCQEKAVGVKPEVVQGTVSIKRLTQHCLGDTAVTLPRVYQHSSFGQGDLEHFLRVCLLDPTFYGFVEKVEGELRKLVEE